MSTQGILKCRFCDWQTTRWSKRGKHNVGKLMDHVATDHPSRYVEMKRLVHRATYDLQDEESCEDAAFFDEDAEHRGG